MIIRLVVASCALLFGAACAATAPMPPAASDPAPAIQSTAMVSIPRPDRVKTPGGALAVTAADVCLPGYASRVRDVSTSTKELVYRSYGVTGRQPGAWQVDHLIPLQLGGSNDIENLWPIRDEGPGGKAQKDALETRLHTLVCTGKVELRDAQAEIASDWYASYLMRIGAN